MYIPPTPFPQLPIRGEGLRPILRQGENAPRLENQGKDKGAWGRFSNSKEAINQQAERRDREKR